MDTQELDPVDREKPKAAFTQSDKLQVLKES